MRARNISTRLCTTRVGLRRSGNTRANLTAKPRRRSAIARSITPPFEVRRPPSKAAVTFLALTAGNENGRIVSSVMAGVAFAVEGDGVGFATESYAASALYTTLASLSGALWRIRRASSDDPLACQCWCFGGRTSTGWTLEPTANVDVSISGLPLFEVAKFLNSVHSERVLVPADILNKRVHLKFKRKPFAAVLKHLGLTTSGHRKKKTRRK